VSSGPRRCSGNGSARAPTLARGLLASGGSFIYLNDTRTTWRTSVFFHDGGRGWNDITYLTDKVGWIIYSPAAFFHGSGKLYTTRDAGLHWHIVTP
jgi:hypothetical protein